MEMLFCSFLFEGVSLFGFFFVFYSIFFVLKLSLFCSFFVALEN